MIKQPLKGGKKMKSGKMKTKVQTAIYVNESICKRRDCDDEEEESLVDATKWFAEDCGFKVCLYTDSDETNGMARQKLFDWIAKRGPKIVIVPAFRHILLSSQDQWDLLDIFTKHNVRFISVEESFDSTSKVARFNHLNLCEKPDTDAFWKSPANDKKQWTGKNRFGRKIKDPFFPPGWNLN